MTNGLGMLCPRDRFYSSYAFRKSSLEIPDCERIVRRVELLSVRWFGMVNGVFVPSAFSRDMEMWLPSRTS